MDITQCAIVSEGMIQHASGQAPDFFTDLLWSFAKITVSLSFVISKSARKSTQAGITEKANPYLWGASSDLEMQVLCLRPYCGWLIHTLQ